MILGVDMCESRTQKPIPVLRGSCSHISSDHSRSCLKTTREMLFITFTYLDVMPIFLEYLLPFGNQEYPEDPYYSNFEERTRLEGIESGKRIVELGWSGFDISVCYNIRSVERSDKQSWPWSIRQCAVHHSFDIVNVRSTWVVIKGNDLMKNRLELATSERGPALMRSYKTIDEAFAAALATHTMFCELSTENAHSYLKHLEHCVQDLTRSATSTKADIPDNNQMDDLELIDALPRRETQRSNVSHVSWRDTLQSSMYGWKDKNAVMSNIPEKEASSPLPTFKNRHGNIQPLPPGVFEMQPSKSENPSFPQDEYGQREYTFRDLQDIQELEEKASGVKLILNLNQNIISQLRNYYVSIMQHDNMPQILRKSCGKDLVRFERRIEGIGNCIKLLVIRAKSLMQLLADRRALVRLLSPKLGLATL